MTDDHDRCEWVNVSSGTGSPGLSQTKSINLMQFGTLHFRSSEPLLTHINYNTIVRIFANREQVCNGRLYLQEAQTMVD